MIRVRFRVMNQVQGEGKGFPKTLILRSHTDTKIINVRTQNLTKDMN